MKEIQEEAYLAQLAELQSRHWPAGTPREPTYPFGEIMIAEYLRNWAGLQPDKAAVIFYGKAMSYAELDRLSDRWPRCSTAMACARATGSLCSCPTARSSYRILWHPEAGRSACAGQPAVQGRRTGLRTQDTGAHGDRAGPAASLVDAVRARTPVQTVFITSFLDLLPDAPTIPVPPSVDGAAPAAAGGRHRPDAARWPPAPAAPAVGRPDLDAVAALNYTGGTTGMPKGCVHTQRDMLYTAATTCTIARRLGPTM